MRWPVLLIAAVVVLFVQLSKARAARADVPAVAASAPSADDMKEARRHFSVGNDLYKDGRYKEALLEFDAAYRLSGRPTALLNVGDCQRQLNAYVDAYDTYQAVLSRHGAQLSAADKSAVQKAIEYLDGHTGQLTVTCNVGDAEVLVDERVVGRTPLAAPLRLDIGSHKVVVRKDGFVRFMPPADVQVLSRQVVTVEAKLVAEVVTGHLSVREQSGREVHVLVDDADKGPAPWEGEVPPGTHTVLAQGEKVMSEKREVSLARGERLEVVLSAVATVGRLKVTALPASAGISVDGRAVGTGQWEGEIEPGAHRIEAALGSSRITRQVVIEKGSSVEQEIAIPVEAPVEDRGLQVGFGGFVVFPFNDYPHINTAAGSTVDSGKMLALGATLHVGYSLGLVSLELASAFLYTHYGDSRDITGIGSMGYDYTSIGGFIGPGVRITTQDPTVRFTVGAALGLGIRSFGISRSAASSPTSQDNGFQANAGYVDPALLIDGGLLLGSTPGARFFVGGLFWIDRTNNDVTVGPDVTSALNRDDYFPSPGRGYLLATRAQVFIGPVLGGQFGH